jgi:4-diphosphocytidyl-2-C-methyl-D-erythritol kinase
MELLAPAKINLYLRVVGRRADGYHDLYSLMCGAALFDRIVLSFDAPKDAIVCSDRTLPTDETNLALRAARLFKRELVRSTGLNPTPVAIHLIKTIPVGAGLGGGSSDAATVLKGMNAHYGDPFDTLQLADMAQRLGADVPFFIMGRPAIAQGIGERLTPFSGVKAMSVVLVYPGFAISTAWVFRNYTLRLTKDEKKIRNFAFGNELFDPARHLCNDLESLVCAYYPEVGAIKGELMAHGAAGALMSGSGSAVFGLFTDRHAACEAGQALTRQAGRQVFVTELLC